MKNGIIALVLLIGVGAGATWAWNKFSDEIRSANAQPVREIAVPVTRQTIESNVEVSGDIEPVVKVEVKAEVSARILKLNVILGGTVEQGQVLVELDDQELRTQKESAELEIAGAKMQVEKAIRDAERNQKLFAKTLVTQQELSDSTTAKDLAVNALQRSQKSLQTVNDKLDKTKVLAPIAGVVLDLPVVQGQVVVAAASVNSGTALMTLADLKRLLISTHVNQVDVARLKPGMPMLFTVDSLPGKKMTGRIDNIAPTATIVKNIKGFTVEMLIENPDPALRPGMTADLIVPVTRAENVLSVPLSAVFSEPDGSKVCFVQKTDKDGVKTSEKRTVEIGLSDTDHVEIVSGVQENESIMLVRPGPAVLTSKRK